MTTPTRATTASFWLITATVNGRSLPPFDTYAGGEVTAESSKRAAAGSTVRRASLGGPRSSGDVTLTCEYHYPVHFPLEKELRPLVGTAEVVVNRQPLDTNRRPYGEPITQTGTLMAMTPPPADSDSTDISFFSLGVSVDE